MTIVSNVSDESLQGREMVHNPSEPRVFLGVLSAINISFVTAFRSPLLQGFCQSVFAQGIPVAIFGPTLQISPRITTKDVSKQLNVSQAQANCLK